MPVIPTSFDDQETANYVWAAETATGIAVDMARFSDITVQATGSGTVTFQGSNDGTNYVALNASNGAGASLAAASNAMCVLLEHPRWLRPVVAGGTATIIALGSGSR